MDNKKVLYYINFAQDAGLNEIELKEKHPEAIWLENKTTDTQGFMLPVEKGLIISFRGTQQTVDWITDINGFQEVIPYDNPSSDIRVHRGFVGAYKSVRQKIHSYINSSTSPIINIWVCGHSLGGALATLCAVDMQYNFPLINIECYPSGSPKVGNKAFADSYNIRVPNTSRTYMRKDLVPELPPIYVEKFFNQKSHHVNKANPIGPKSIFYGLIQWFKRKLGTDELAEYLTNHSIDLYKKYL
jgi:triacylglycerol lipase